MRHRWTIAAYVIVVIAWMVIRVSVFSHLRLIEFPDSKSFLAKAAEPLWTRDYFFGSGRFFVVPLFYKIVFVISAQKAALAVAQSLLATGAWLTFAWTLAARIRPAWLSVTTLAAVLAFALGSEIIQGRHGLERVDLDLALRPARGGVGSIGRRPVGGASHWGDCSGRVVELQPRGHVRVPGSLPVSVRPVRDVLSQS